MQHNVVPAVSNALFNFSSYFCIEVWRRLGHNTAGNFKQIVICILINKNNIFTELLCPWLDVVCCTVWFQPNKRLVLHYIVFSLKYREHKSISVCVCLPVPVCEGEINLNHDIKLLGGKKETKKLMETKSYSVFWEWWLFANALHITRCWPLHVWTEPTDNASVNFVKYNGDYYVSTETNYMRRIDPQSLETKEKVSSLPVWTWLWMEEGAHDDAIDCSRWTGVNTSLSAQPRPTRTTILKGQRTTWATPTAKAVTTRHSLHRLSLTIHLCPRSCAHSLLRYNVVCCWAYSGFFYNIIRVPPPDVQSANRECADLTGAEVICSIQADEPRKPSYYHSFGKMLPLYAGRVLYVPRQGTFDCDSQPGCILHRQSVTFFYALINC